MEQISIWIVVLVSISDVGEASRHLNSSHAYQYEAVDLCSRPSPDPCHPGGKWDSLLNKYVMQTTI